MISPQPKSFSTESFPKTVLVSFALIYQTFISSLPSTTEVTMDMFGSLNGSSLKTPRKNIISNLSFKIVVSYQNAEHAYTVPHKQAILLT